MRRIGFSTGALAKGDFERGLALHPDDCAAVELSALRANEVDDLIRAIPRLDLSRFEYVSFHAPSHIEEAFERELAQKLLAITDHVDGFILHPEVVITPEIWRALGSKVVIENMDQRKEGRNARELRPCFEALPEAGFCLDMGHARQIDPTMSVAYELLKEYGSRLVELHVSEVDTDSRHMAVSQSAADAFRRLSSLVPEHIPIIIESMVEPCDIVDEVRIVREAFEGKPSHQVAGLNRG